MTNIEALVMFKEPQKKAEAIDLVAGLGGTMKIEITHKESIVEGKPESMVAYGAIISISPEKVENIRKHPATCGVYTKHISKQDTVPRDSPYFDPQWMWNQHLQYIAFIRHNQRAERAEYDRMSKVLSDMIEEKT